MHEVRLQDLEDVHEVRIYGLSSAVTGAARAASVFIRAGIVSTQENFDMLADIIIARATFGGDRGRDDLHRHATFSCGVRNRMRRLFRMLHLA